MGHRHAFLPAASLDSRGPRPFVYGVVHLRYKDDIFWHKTWGCVLLDDMLLMHSLHTELCCRYLLLVWLPEFRRSQQPRQSVFILPLREMASGVFITVLFLVRKVHVVIEDVLLVLLLLCILCQCSFFRKDCLIGEAWRKNVGERIWFNCKSVQLRTWGPSSESFPAAKVSLILGAKRDSCWTVCERALEQQCL